MVGVMAFARLFIRRVEDRTTTLALIWIPITLSGLIFSLTFLLGFLFPTRKLGEIASEDADEYVWIALVILAIATIAYVLL